MKQKENKKLEKVVVRLEKVLKRAEKECSEIIDGATRFAGARPSEKRFFRTVQHNFNVMLKFARRNRKLRKELNRRAKGATQKRIDSFGEAKK